MPAYDYLSEYFCIQTDDTFKTTVVYIINNKYMQKINVYNFLEFIFRWSVKFDILLTINYNTRNYNTPEIKHPKSEHNFLMPSPKSFVIDYSKNFWEWRKRIMPRFWVWII